MLRCEESQRLSPRDFTFEAHSLLSGTYRATVNPDICSAVPSAASETVKPSIYTKIINIVQVKGEGITLIFFIFVGIIDFLSFWLSTGLPFYHLHCVFNKRGQFSSLKLLKAQASIHRSKSLVIHCFSYIVQNACQVCTYHKIFWEAEIRKGDQIKWD